MAKENQRIFGIREIKEILNLLDQTDIEEIELVKGDFKIRIKKRGPAPIWIPQHAAPPISPVSGETLTPLPSTEPRELAGNLVTVNSPMVGTFYRAPHSGAEPFVKEGEVVKKGKVLCIIEAMKLMNEIETEFPGRIHSILAENAQPVEYGQPLFQIEPL